MRQVRKSIMFFLLLGLSVLLFSCGGGGGGGETPTSPTTLNISGTWDGSYTVTESNCSNSPVGTTRSATFDITQTGSSVTMTVDRVTLTGTLSGDQLTLEGTSGSAASPERLTIRATVSSDGRSMNGTFESVLLNPSGSCTSVSGTLTATKR